MAYLYQDIMKVPGLSGTAGQRQAQLYGNLGSPMGGYKGSYDQNMYLLNNINKGNYGSASPAAAGGGSSNGIPTPTTRTAFGQVLPFEKVFDKNAVTGLAENQINPEVARKRMEASRGLESQLGSTGVFRTGLAGQQRQNLSDMYERMRKEQVQQFIGAIQDPLTNWYNQQSEKYYTNPSGYTMPTLPTYDQFINNNPNLQTYLNGGSTTYTNPLMY